MKEEKEAKGTSSETQTATDENNEKTAWKRFCHKRGINHNLIWLKVTLFVMHGGMQKVNISKLNFPFYA
jgi:hypothetical protein